MTVQEYSIPFYDPTRTYLDNYYNGPFCLFRKERIPDANSRYTSFLGFDLSIPFGIPAGPLINGTYAEKAWEYGYSIATYKTVRSRLVEPHMYPNIIRVPFQDQNIYPGDTVFGDTDILAADIYRDGITNSFAVPSMEPVVWQEDVRHTLRKMNKGNVLVLSFMGTQEKNKSRDDYIDDFVHTARLAVQTGAPILEVNLSCPNYGKEGMMYLDIGITRDILEAVHAVCDQTPLLVKVGYVPQADQISLERLLDITHAYAEGISAINTIQVKVVDKNGGQLLPGDAVRLYSGICGATIRWAGLEMTERIVAYKKKQGWKDFTVVGVGGVISVDDYMEYVHRGADAVQSATGAMWRPDLANEIRKARVFQEEM